MLVRCSSCNKPVFVSASAVAGGQAVVACKACKSQLLVTKDGGVSPADGASAAEAQDTGPAPAVAAPPAPEPIPAAIPPPMTAAAPEPSLQAASTQVTEATPLAEASPAFAEQPVESPIPQTPVAESPADDAVSFPPSPFGASAPGQDAAAQVTPSPFSSQVSEPDAQTGTPAAGPVSSEPVLAASTSGTGAPFQPGVGAPVHQPPAGMTLEVAAAGADEPTQVTRAPEESFALEELTELTDPEDAPPPALTFADTPTATEVFAPPAPTSQPPSDASTGEPHIAGPGPVAAEIWAPPDAQPGGFGATVSAVDELDAGTQPLVATQTGAPGGFAVSEAGPTAEGMSFPTAVPQSAVEPNPEAMPATGGLIYRGAGPQHDGRREGPNAAPLASLAEVGASAPGAASMRPAAAIESGLVADFAPELEAELLPQVEVEPVPEIDLGPVHLEELEPVSQVGVHPAQQVEAQQAQQVEAQQAQQVEAQQAQQVVAQQAQQVEAQQAQQVEAQQAQQVEAQQAQQTEAQQAQQVAAAPAEKGPPGADILEGLEDAVPLKKGGVLKYVAAVFVLVVVGAGATWALGLVEVPGVEPPAVTATLLGRNDAFGDLASGQQPASDGAAADAALDTDSDAGAIAADTSEGSGTGDDTEQADSGTAAKKPESAAEPEPKPETATVAPDHESTKRVKQRKRKKRGSKSRKTSRKPTTKRASSSGSTSEHYAAAVTYIKQKKPTKAIEELKKALKSNSRHAKSYRLLGMAYKMAGQEKKAIQSWERFVKLDPGHSDATKLRAVIADYYKRNPR